MDWILDDCLIPIIRSVVIIITSLVEKKDARRTQDGVEAFGGVTGVCMFQLKTH